MGWNILFESPGYAMVTNQILELLDYKSIMVCREVSPIWKKYIDEERIGRVSHLLSLMDKFGKINDKLFPNNYHDRKKVYSFGKKFPEWKEIMPYIKTEMSMSDMDKLIAAELYTDFDELKEELEDWIENVHDEHRAHAKYWCPLQWAIHFGNFEFVDVMIRSPFDFSKLKFMFEDNIEEKASVPPFRNIRRPTRYECVDDNNVLHKAARVGNIEIIKLILKYAEEKKIDINAKNSFNQSALVTAKDDPEVVKLLMKHCKYNDSDIGLLGLNTLATMAKSYVEKDEPPKKKKAKKF